MQVNPQGSASGGMGSGVSIEVADTDTDLDNWTVSQPLPCKCHDHHTHPTLIHKQPAQQPEAMATLLLGGPAGNDLSDLSIVE